MRIEKQEAPVYVAHGVARVRRWTGERVEVVDVPVQGRVRRLTRFAAYVALARAYCDAHCQCEEGEPEVGVPHYLCRYHDSRSHRWDKETITPHGTTVLRFGELLVARLARYLRWLDQREREVRRLIRTELSA